METYEALNQMHVIHNGSFGFLNVMLMSSCTLMGAFHLVFKDLSLNFDSSKSLQSLTFGHTWDIQEWKKDNTLKN